MKRKSIEADCAETWNVTTDTFVEIWVTQGELNFAFFEFSIFVITSDAGIDTDELPLTRVFSQIHK